VLADRDPHPLPLAAELQTRYQEPRRSSGRVATDASANDKSATSQVTSP
jgi:hypothetical protein